MAGNPHPVFPDGVPVEKANARAYLPLRLGNPDALRALDGSTFWLCYIQTLLAFFYRDTSDTTSEDNGTSVIVDGNGGVWKFISSEAGIAIGAAGPVANRGDFDIEDPGFTYFGTDTELLYVRLTAGGWSDGSTIVGPQGPEGAASTVPGPAGTSGTNGASSLTVVRLVATSNVTIASGLENGDTVDGVTLVTGDFVLLSGQTAAAENGIYQVVASGAASRATAFNTYDSMPGCYFSVMEGTAGADKLYRCTSNKGGTLGTDALAFSEFTSGGGTGSVSVADRTALKVLSTSGAGTVILLEAGREGAFTLRSGSVPLSDPNEGVYVASNTSGFYWERLAHNRTFNVRWFGAVLDNSTDDTSAIQAAINFASLFTSTTAGPRAAVYCPPGFSVKTTAQLSFIIPIKIDFQSVIFYNNTTGRAMFFNEAQPTNASYFSYWDVFLQGIYAVPATAAFPASINTSGPIGISIRGMIFSKFECREGIGFSNTFLELDGRGLTYASNNQTILHNTFTLGQIANNGLGISLKSLDAATSSVEGNRFFIQQINQNCFNIVDGDATYQASTSNTYDINAMDNATTIGIDTYCPYNKWYIGFAGAPGTTLRTNAGCDYSRFEFGNNETTDIVLNYNGGGNHNQILTQTPSALPATQTAVSGTAYQNTFGVPVTVSVAVSGGGQVDMRVDSPDGAEILVGNAAANGFITFPVLPHGWKWKLFTTSGTVTYGTAHIFAAL